MKDDKAAFGRNLPEFVVFSVVISIGIVLFAKTFQKPWYIGLIAGPLVATILSGPRKVVRTLAEYWDTSKQ